MTPDNEKRFNDIVASLDKLPYDERVAEVDDLIEACRLTIGRLAAAKGAAMRELRRDATLQELADRFGLTPQRIAQILDR